MLAHNGGLTGPHDVWRAWTFDPLTIALLAVAVVLFVRGVRPGDGALRARAFSGAVLGLIVALVSPIDALGETLLTFHMIQHVLLVSLVGPLLALADAGPILARGLPARWRRAPAAARRAVGLDMARVRSLRHPALRYGFFVVVLWTWHASRLYSLAVENRWVHIAEHLGFLAAGLGVWSVMVGAARHRADLGIGVMMAFGLMLQGVALSALMVFAREPWYAVYANPDPAWGLDALADQHLAGLIMWFVGGASFILAGVGLAVRWVGANVNDEVASPVAPRSIEPSRLPTGSAS